MRYQQSKWKDDPFGSIENNIVEKLFVQFQNILNNILNICNMFILNFI